MDLSIAGEVDIEDIILDAATDEQLASLFNARWKKLDLNVHKVEDQTIIDQIVKVSIYRECAE